MSLREKTKKVQLPCEKNLWDTNNTFYLFILGGVCSLVFEVPLRTCGVPLLFSIVNFMAIGSTQVYCVFSGVNILIC